ncbi:MAG: pirin family protein [Bacteroidota bacterium]
MSSVIKNIKPLGFPWETQDPFIFCVFHHDDFPAGNGQMGVKEADRRGRNIGSDFTVKDGFRMYHGSEVPGFPYHPHRGFETITINREGVVDHTDSLGAAGRFMAGDVQWMTAGKGVLHSEMFPLQHDDQPNTLEIFQIWLNLARASKMVEPHFKMLWREEIPVVERSDANGRKTTIDIIAGNLYEQQAPSPTPDSWAADPDHAVGVFTIKMEANAQWTLPASHADSNRSLYFYEGESIQIEGQSIPSNLLVELEAGQELVIQNGPQEASLLVLQGRPINEPVVSYGPFVMNSQEEIQQAFADYQRTQFGGWPWPEKEQTHAAERGRFALHADGREEIKEY